MEIKFQESKQFWQQFKRPLKWGVLTLALSVGLLILAPFKHYFLADFDYGFLRDKREFFFNSGYFIAFYAHIVGAPAAFFVGTFQTSRSLRARWPRLHRRLGQIYCILVLVAASPGGLVMGLWAYGGLSSQLCFSLLAGSAWVTTFFGWRYGRLRIIDAHAEWMTRSYLLLASAICLRLTHPLISTLRLDHELTYQVAVWMSWLTPLGLFELLNRFGYLTRQRRDSSSITSG